jgi:hypothetical protein
MLCVAFQFLGVLEKELAKFEKNKDDFLSDFTQVIQQKPLRTPKSWTRPYEHPSFSLWL